MKKFLPAVLIFCLIIALPSCGEGKTKHENKKIDAYISSDSSFTLTFPPTCDGGESVTAECEKTAASVTLLITAPERSSGIKITHDLTLGTSAVSISGGGEIPLSHEASVGLTTVLCALFPQSYTVASSEDGVYRLIISDSGTSYIDGNGSPIKAECSGREISLSSFAAK